MNRSQSTNDVYPTAIRLAVLNSSASLLSEYGLLRDALDRKATEFQDIVKVGRTQLQDAVPMTVGDEFAAFAATLSDNIGRVRQTRDALRETNLGGTAIGNGISAPQGYRELVVKKLSEASGYDFYSAENLFGATYDQGALVLFSSALKSVAVKLSKISSDLRLLSSGPRAGLGELNLSAMQAGSSIMPGKVNPVIPEVVNQVCFAVIGNDLTVTLAAEAGELQLNAMEPVLLHRLLDSINLLENALRTRCIDGITVDRDRCQALFDGSLVLATELAGHVGYDLASAVAHQAKREGIGLMDAIKCNPNISRDDLPALTGQRTDRVA
ncbi:MAG: lyase family protein [Octadecabacter sp.]|nr:lyase family protein [Octadecabacter sp.]